jgi:hypothetical protein
MQRKFLGVALAAVLLVAGTSAKAQAWGGLHAGFTHFGPGGVYHAGFTAARGPYGGYAGFHAGGVGAYGYHYGYGVDPYGYGGAYAGYHAYSPTYGYAAAGYHYSPVYGGSGYSYSGGVYRLY